MVILMAFGAYANRSSPLFHSVLVLCEQVTVPTLLVHGADDDIAYSTGSEQMSKLLTGCSNVDVEVLTK